MSSLFSQTGGARIGFFNASWPLAKLSATCEALRLTCLGREYVFLKRDVQGLSRYGGGLRIVHTVSAFPEFVVFWTFRFDALKRGLEGLGYEVRVAAIYDERLDRNAFVAGGLSFIPFVGVLFGIVAIARGLTSQDGRGKALATVGAAGIVFNILFLRGLF